MEIDKIMENNRRVLIDCDKVKYNNTGLYTFCVELSKALALVGDENNISPRFLVKKKNVGLFESSDVRVLNLFDSGYFRCNEDLFHATFQFSKYIPANKKYVLTIHDLNFLYEKDSKKFEKYFNRINKIVKNASYVVFISEFVKKDFIRIFGPLHCRSEVVYNGCTLYDREQIESPSAYKPRGEFLFTVATVLPKKNFHVLPCLLKKNNMELIIAGRLSDYSEKIIKEAERFGVADRVKLVGEISDEDKDWYYRQCKAFLFPSIAEGFGIPVIESLAYGKPTFISLHTALPEIGGKYCYYFNYDFDREKMINEFETGMADFSKRDVNEQIDYARSFTWEKAARKYCRIYNSI